MSRLPVLMYHNFCRDDDNSKGLTISKSNFEAQLEYLSNNGYTSLHFSEIYKKKQLPNKSIILTFDDVYANQLKIAYPLLFQYNMKACFYIPFAYLGGYDVWNTNKEAIMTIEQLKSLDSSIVELGFHSYAHGNYNEMSKEDVEIDFDKCMTVIKENQLKISNVLAYPYGKFPRDSKNRAIFFETLKKQNISFGLRIGNRINTFPFRNNFEINRIDIKGEDSLPKFKRKLKYGAKWF